MNQITAGALTDALIFMAVAMLPTRTLTLATTSARVAARHQLALAA